MSIDLVIRAAQILAALEDAHEGAMEAVLAGLGHTLEADARKAATVATQRLQALGVDFGGKAVTP